MKVELSIDTDKLVSNIVAEVVKVMKPLLKHITENNELMTVEELAKYLNVKKPSIYDKIHNRAVPFLKNDNLLRFRRKDIDMWLLNPYHPDLSAYNLNHGRKRYN